MKSKICKSVKKKKVCGIGEKTSLKIKSSENFRQKLRRGLFNHPVYRVWFLLIFLKEKKKPFLWKEIGRKSVVSFFFLWALFWSSFLGLQFFFSLFISFQCFILSFKDIRHKKRKKTLFIFFFITMISHGGKCDKNERRKRKKDAKKTQNVKKSRERPGQR